MKWQIHTECYTVGVYSSMGSGVAFLFYFLTFHVSKALVLIKITPMPNWKVWGSILQCDIYGLVERRNKSTQHLTVLFLKHHLEWNVSRLWVTIAQPMSSDLHLILPVTDARTFSLEERFPFPHLRCNLTKQRLSKHRYKVGQKACLNIEEH